MERDIELLLQLLQHPTNESAVNDALRSLADLLSTSVESKDVFRDKHGLDLLLRVLTTTKKRSTLQRVLFTLSCAVDNNVSSQNLLLQRDVMAVLRKILGSSSKGHQQTQGEEWTCQSVLCLLSFLTKGNSLAQKKIRQFGILRLLVTWLQKTDASSDNLTRRLSLLLVLSSAVNNPRNRENQELCVGVLPLCLVALREHISEPSVVQTLTSFLTLILSDNGMCQEKFGVTQGVELCVSLLRKVRDSDTAAELLVLINAAPLALQKAVEVQERCVEETVRWLAPCPEVALHTLLQLAEWNTRCRSNLAADRHTMATVVRLVGTGAENIASTARLLLQLLFNSQQHLLPGDTTALEGEERGDSDLESAGYEAEKSRERKSRERKIVTKKRSHVVIRRRWNSPPAIANPPDSPPKSTSKPFRTLPKTPRLSPTPDTQQEATVPTPQATAENNVTTPLSCDVTAPLRDVTVASNAGAVDIASVVNQAVNERMEAFLARFQQVISAAPSLRDQREDRVINASAVPPPAYSTNRKGVRMALPPHYTPLSSLRSLPPSTPRKELLFSPASHRVPPYDTPLPPFTPTAHRLPSDQESMIGEFFSENPDLVPMTQNIHLQRKQSLVRDFPTPACGSDTASTIQGDPFTEQELANLCKGVQFFGHAWSVILMKFEFRASRTPYELRRKYFQIKRHVRPSKQPWSDQEMRRLRRGVETFGTDWEKIRSSFTFHKSRGVQDLCDQWLVCGE